MEDWRRVIPPTARVACMLRGGVQGGCALYGCGACHARPVRGRRGGVARARVTAAQPSGLGIFRKNTALCMHLRFWAVCGVAKTRNSHGYCRVVRLAAHPDPQRTLTARCAQRTPGRTAGRRGYVGCAPCCAVRYLPALSAQTPDSLNFSPASRPASASAAFAHWPRRWPSAGCVRWSAAAASGRCPPDR